MLKGITRQSKNLSPINAVYKGISIPTTAYTFPTPLVGTYTISGYLSEDAVGTTEGGWVYLIYYQDNTYKQLAYRSTLKGQVQTITFTATSNNPITKISTRSPSWFSVGGLKDIMLNEGSTALPYEPYGIYIKTFNEEITKQGKNLFDNNNIPEYWINTSGAFVPSSNCAGRMLEIEQGATYYFTTDWVGSTGYTCLAQYDANKNFISGTRKIVTSPTNNKEIVSVTVTNTNTKYVAFATYQTSPNWWMVRKDDSSTDYEPYGNYLKPIKVGVVKTILPQGYTEREYVENTNSTTPACIDTGIYLNGEGHKAEVEYEFDATIEVAKRTLFGAQHSQNLMTLYCGSGYACGDSEIGVTGRVTTAVYQAGRHTVSFEMLNNKATYIYDNATPRVITISSSVFNDTSLADTYPVYMFANNNAGAKTQLLLGKIYRFKFWQHGVLVRDMLPCTRDSDNAVGMYDIVNNSFYTSATATPLIAGEVATNPHKIIQF